MTHTSRHPVASALRSIAVLFAAMGLDPRQLRHIRHLPRYLSQASAFKRLGGAITEHYPILSDYAEQAGSARGHYFHQDLLVAGFVFRAQPQRHIDIGSRIDGFVAHVAAFRPIEVMDVRALGSTGHDNIRFIQANLMDRANAPQQIADSVSCLHAIEHFGLGRYGDPLDPTGHVKGFNNIVGMVKVGGVLYISFPIADATQVMFNAHRAFHPREVLGWAEDPGSLRLERFDYVDAAGDLHAQADLDQLGSIGSGCGIYTFRRLR